MWFIRVSTITTTLQRDGCGAQVGAGAARHHGKTTFGRKPKHGRDFGG